MQQLVRPARRTTAVCWAALLLCALQLVGRAAQAKDGARSRTSRVDPPALDLAAATRVPLSLGPELGLELPGRVLLQAHVGWMPAFYGNTLNGALSGAGAYDSAVEAVIKTSLESVTSWRVAAGWRPFRSAGLELLAGYTHMALSGETTTGEVLPLLDREAAARVREEVGVLDLRLSSSVQAFTLGAGWRWLIADQIVVRASIEYMQAFASKSRLEIGGSSELTRLAAPTVQNLMNQYYLDYVKVPLVGLCLGYRFF